MSWAEANRDAVLSELALVRAWVRGRAASRDVAAATDHVESARRQLDGPSTLDEVADGFGLSEFERALLLLVAGPELVADVGTEVAEVSGLPRPTFGLGLDRLPQAHWGALTPRAPLRYWRLVHLLDPASPTHSPLVIDERVLHHLLGAGYLDSELAAVARTVPAPAGLPPTLAGAAARVVAAWEAGQMVVLPGSQRGNLSLVASAAAAAVGRDLNIVDAADVPTAPDDRARLARLMEREAVLGRCAWAIEATRSSDPAATLRALQDLDAPAAVLTEADAPTLPETAAVVAVPRVPVPERRAVLEDELTGRCVPTDVLDDAAPAATAFDLALPDLRRAAADASHGDDLWLACRSRAARRFDGLAQVIEPRATWDDLVLPAAQSEQLQALVAAVRHRSRVLDDWGFADRSARGLGTAALFAGPSGTGKTLAAEVIASTLGLDLVVVDLSQVVSKYIGETEKNLRRVFDAAEDSAAVLLFDEADTLFGKRTEIRDSHDRYANLEVGYLLQRIESFRGLAVLTTNAKSVLDQAFLRRLRFIVSFPYPDAVARERLWRLAFPAAVPTVGVDPARMAAIDLPGGGIAAAALTAAYLGAARGEVTPEDVAAATKWELAKLGRSVAGR